MNEQSASLKIVQKVWLFGSAMRGQDTVSDIDLAIETADNPAFEDDASYSARLRELIDQAPNHLPYFRKLYWHEEQSIFGERRHPLLAGAHMGSYDLQKLGVPCQLIFDRSRGGRVDDEIISRHPDSVGRSNEMGTPSKLPDWGPISAVPRPMDARWMSSYKVDGRVSPHRLFPERQTVPGSGSIVMTDNTEACWHRWWPTSLKAGGCDGVTKVLLKYHDSWRDPKGQHAASMLLQREIRDLETEIELRIKLSDFGRPRRLKPKRDHSLIHLCGMVAMIMCGDMYRQTVRLQERKLHKIIAIDIEASELPDPFRATAPVWIESLLKDLAPSANSNEAGHSDVEPT